MNRTHLVVVAGSSLVSLGMGLAIGQALAKRRLEKRYQEFAAKEINEAKAFYGALHKKDEFQTPEMAVERLIPREILDPDLLRRDVLAAVEAIRVYQGDDLPLNIEEGRDLAESIAQETRNVFTDARPTGVDFDYEEEIAARSPDKPYIISHEEFLAAEPEYHQTTLTYYSGDDVLADERDQYVDNVDMVVGTGNLRFGHRSNDNNVVYIRNDQMTLDFEVLRSTGKYTREVLGLDDEAAPSRYNGYRGDHE